MNVIHMVYIDINIIYNRSNVFVFNPGSKFDNIRTFPKNCDVENRGIVRSTYTLGTFY